MKKYNAIYKSVPDGTPGVRPPIDPIIKVEIRRQPPNGSVARKYHKLTLQDMLRKYMKKSKMDMSRGCKQSKKYPIKKGNRVWKIGKNDVLR